VHIAEINMVRLHAMLIAIGQGLWEESQRAPCCLSSRRQPDIASALASVRDWSVALEMYSPF
jgi:hypothetical protein